MASCIRRLHALGRSACPRLLGHPLSGAGTATALGAYAKPILHRSAPFGLLLGMTFAVGTGHAATCAEQRQDDEEVAARTVPLAITRREASGNKGPVLVFIHGLDSWRGTWRRPADELASRGFASISLDLRGHGESPLGAPCDFGPRQLAADVRAAVRQAGLLDGGARIALVGHSMGGMVAMRYAAEYPQDLAVLVIEDIDCVPWGEPPPSKNDLKRIQRYNRHCSSMEACQAELVSFGYSKGRVQGWLVENPPRLFEHPTGGVWSAINPHAQHLATDTVGNRLDAYEALQHIAAARACCKGDFKVHLLVAGQGDLPEQADKFLPGGIHDMCAIMPGLVVSEFPQANHSIHNTALMDLVDAVERILLA
mmetsp:Transcript_53349/g.155466  ORF Transcript_53349/g.155466 Transcript_53349/m.155466 type:complete len:368 (+) Transcript_53349:43-1146(+)